MLNFYHLTLSPFQPLRVHLPHVEFSDCVLNLLFLFLLVIMVLCGWVAIFYLGTPERRQFLRLVPLNYYLRARITESELRIF